MQLRDFGMHYERRRKDDIMAKNYSGYVSSNMFVYLLDERNLIPQPILSPGSDRGPNGEPTSRLRNKRPSPGQKAKESLTRPGKLSKLNKRLTIPIERVR